MVDILAVVLAKVGGRVLSALVQGRDLDRGDASAVVTALLEALVAGTNQTAEALGRIEQKVDALSLQPYQAAITAGQRLLQDAAPARRSQADRVDLLRDARSHFADAVGYAGTNARLRADAEVLYGLVWLAAGSPDDTNEALARAARVLEDECLLTFAEARKASIAHNETLAKRKTPLGRLQDAIVGHDPAENILLTKSGSAFDREWIARHQLGQLQAFRGVLFSAPARYPTVDVPPDRPWDFDLPGACHWVFLVPSRAGELFGVEAQIDMAPASAGTYVKSIRLSPRRDDPIAFTTSVVRGNPSRDGTWRTALERSAFYNGVLPTGAELIPAGSSHAAPLGLFVDSTSRFVLNVRVGGPNSQRGVVRFSTAVG